MTHIKGYLRKDGTFVPAHEDRRTAEEFYHQPRREALPWWMHSDEDEGDSEERRERNRKVFFPNAVEHPQINHKGEAVQINEPSKETPKTTWADPKAIATFLPEGDVPKVLNGVPLKAWEDHPVDDEGWSMVEGQDPDIDDELPPLGLGSTKEPAASVIIEEDDGRVWVIHPTNRFGGYKSTFPKGHQDEGLDLQATAIKEAFEESGLQVEITGWSKDVERTTTVCRYYTAKRVGGTPAAMGWESQAVSLVPRKKLYEVLDRETDHPLAEALGAGPRPKPKWAPLPPSKSYDQGKKWKDGKPPTLFDDLNDFPLPPPKKVAKPQEAPKQAGVVSTPLPPPKLQKPAAPPAPPAPVPAPPATEPEKKSKFGWIKDRLSGGHRWGWF